MHQFKKFKKKPANGNASPNRHSGKAKQKNIQHELDSFLQKNKTVAAVAETIYTPHLEIATLPLNKQLLNNMLAHNFKHLTEIQDKCMEPLLKGRNLMGIAQTGTGKTAAYLTPLIHNLLTKTQPTQTIVIVPTRELAVQVETEFKLLTRGTGLTSIFLIGGTSVQKNLNDLNKKHHFVIGTPGRLNDLKRLKALKLDRFETVVLDEFDRLLDMGFLKDIMALVDAMSNRQQTILLSATEEPGQKNIVQKLLQQPVEVRVSNGSTASDNVEQTTIRLKPEEDKFNILSQMLKTKDFEKVLVFVETKHNVTKLWKKLNAGGHSATQIHGNISQNKRLQAIQDFKDGKARILLATDIAARGLDICNVSHVINYEVPRTMDSYIHRIGRTGRAGKKGKALTFINATA